MSTITSSGPPTERLEPKLDDFYREHYALVFRTAYGVTGSAEDAEDIVQTIFLRMLRREFPPESLKDPRAYLYRAAVNVSLSVVRQRRRHVLTGDSNPFEIAPHAIGANPLEELHKRLYDAIAELPPEQAEILILRYVHEYTNGQIAQLLRTSRGAVAVKLFRSRFLLKQLVRDSQREKKS
jgi:RNA polymerase sigma-70 factor, ECF subfamily